jgi:methyl-accepting chemotaxis protein
MDETIPGREGARASSRLLLKLSTSVELPSYACCAPALAAYLLINFLGDEGKALSFIAYCLASCAATFALGVLARAAALAPYASWAKGESKGEDAAERARRALLDLPAAEALSIFLRWAATCPIIFGMSRLFGGDFGTPFWTFAGIACCLIGVLAMPASFLGSELACSPALNSPGLAEGEARPRLSFSLRRRLALSVSAMVDYLAAVFIMHMAFILQGSIDPAASMVCLYILVAGTLMMVVIIMRLFDRSLSRTIRTMNAKFEEMNRNSGDLTVRLDVIARDDVGTLSASFNSFMGFLRSSISEVKRSAEQGRSIGTELAATADESSAAATQMAAGMTGLGRRTRGLMEAVRGQKESIGAANGALSSFSEQVDGQAAAVEESSAAINQMIANIAAIEASTKDKRRLVEVLKADGAEGDRILEEITSLVDEVARSAETIMELIDVIVGISKSTDLLAMNAAIEAAHAGAAGKGFAVVADEIRKLAESTGSNSKDIAASLGGIVEKIVRSAELSARTKAVFKKVFEGIAVVEGSMEETLSGLTEISAGGGQIVDSVAELSTLATGLREAGREIGDRIRSIKEEAEKVAALAEENERSAVEIGEGIGEIASASTALSELGNRNAESIALLDGEAARFRLA